MTTRDERLLVLRLLRERKITPEEAERLLRALSSKKDESHEKRFGFEQWFERFGKELWDVSFDRFAREMEAFGERLRRHFEGFRGETQEGSSPSENESDQVDLPEDVWVRVSHKGGDLTVEASGDRHVKVTAPKWNLQLAPDKRQADISTTGGPATLLLPSQTRRLTVESVGGNLNLRGLALISLSARGVGGFVALENVTADIDVEVVGGGVELNEVVGGVFRVRTSGGEIRARLVDVREGSYDFAALGGGIRLALGEMSDFEVEYSLSGGFFNSDWSGERIAENRLRVGTGSAKFRLAVTGGEICLLRRKGSKS